MAYEKQTWVDGVTPLDAAHLNHMEQGISQLSTGEPGADGKSAYAYAVEGGYTGTEAEFAAKLAQEKFANPYALTFAGAVTGSYDGSEPLTAEIPSGGSGLTTAQVNALDGMFKVCAFIKDDVSAEYTEFKTAFGIADSGGETEVTLTSISATYDGGDVAVGTAVTDLTGIVVTAHYSDGSTAEVTGYTLSGTIVEGSNTITVSYNGKTATFTVTGVADTTENLLYSWDFTKSLTDSLSGEVATLNGSATQDSGGVHLTALTDYIGLGGLVTAVNRAYELDMGDMERSGNQHGRLLIHDSTAGFMYRNSGYWTWWSGPGWCDSTGLTAFDDIANKTIRIEVDASGYQTLYVDGNQVATSSLAVGGSASNKGYEGYAITIGSSVGNSAAISTIKAFRVYNLGGA